MSLLKLKTAALEMRLMAQKAKQLPSTLPQHLNQVAAFSTKSKKPPASNLRRRNANRKPAPNSLSKSTSRDTSGSSFQAQGATIGPYGLRRIDYTVVPPKWKLPPHPPPRKNPVRRYFPLMVLGTGLVFFAFVIVYRDDDEMAEYWKQVDTGYVPMDGDDDDEEDEDLDIDDDFDEWEDVKKPERN